MLQLTTTRLSIAWLAALLLLGATSGARAQQPEFIGDPELLPDGHAVRVSVDLRSLPAPPEWRPGDPIKTIPRRIHPRSPDDMPAVVNEQKRGYVDPLVEIQTDATRSFAPESGPLSLVHNFEGSTFSGVYPPDPVGEVGLVNYVQMINHSSAGSQVRFYDKVTGVEVANFALQSLAPPGSGCSDGLGDPIALFDHLADRWFLSEFANDPPNALCLYISQTSDPLAGGWFHYQINTTTFPDYPKYSVWPDAYYVNTNESAHTNYALDRENMLLGAPIRPSIRRTFPCLDGWLFCTTPPIDLDGPAPPPGTPGMYIRQVDDELHCALGGCVPDPLSDHIEIWEFSTDWLVPANSTLTKVQEVPTAEFDSLLCDIATFRCVPQPVPNPLDPLREAVMWKPQYRNFGTHESIVGNFVTDVTGTDYHGIRWFELRRIGGGPWSVHQEGTFSGLSQDPADVEHRWMAGSGMDGFGNIGLAYSVSSQATFPGIRFTGREAADPLGAMTHGDNTLIEGSGPSLPFERWGDYHSMNIDPVDDCTFWFTGMHSQDLTGDWTTQVGAFRFPACDNLDPTAIADVAETTVDTAVEIDVLANDSDPNGDPLDLDTVTDPPNGSAVLNDNDPAPDTITYTPDPGFTGTDNFAYSVVDGQGGSATGTVTVTVNPLESCTFGNPLFADSFESGDFSAWLASGGRVQDPQGDLGVIAPPTTLDGALAMSVALDHNPPTDEEMETWVTAKHQPVSNYCWSFWLDTSELAMAEGRLLKIWGARASDNQRLLDLALRRNTAGAATTWSLGLKVWRDNLTGKKLPFADIPDGKVLVAGEWSTTAEGGVLRLYANGVLLDELTGLGNVNRLLTTPGMGNLGLFKPGTVGTLYFDGFASGWTEP